jgi:histidinol-phosphate aminotransferase
MVSGSALGRHVLFSSSAEADTPPLIRLSFNENPYGPSPAVATAIQREFTRLNCYADAPAAQRLTEQIAGYEHISPGAGCTR